MLSRFFIFYIITLLTGSPLLAILVIVGLYFALDYQFTGFFRRGVEIFRLESEISGLKREIALNPHNVASLSDLGRLLVMRGKGRQGLPYLERAYERLSDSEETTYYLGLASIASGDEPRGEALILKALQKNPKFRYGEPALRLAEYYAARGRNNEAQDYFDRFFSIHSSSPEGYYKFGLFQLQIGNVSRAVESFRKAIEVFKLSPSFKRRQDRLWAYKARFHLGKTRLASGAR
ncbi:MAG: tetratricopeptide repeat protein [Nitrospirae bacterium]|nr:tetratricopeptide repeat protein [Candidatus Manganitrophaceae bacterium]